MKTEKILSNNPKEELASEKIVERLTFINVLYILFVILFGAYVRASGSGAGCGNHWPLCNGEMIPQTPQLKTMVEYTHRITSGLSLPFLLLICFFIKKAYPKFHRMRKVAGLVFMFLILEALIGAFLVRMEHVAENRSIYRAFSMSFHLVNTYFLMAWTALLYFLSKDNLPKVPRMAGSLSLWAFISFALFLLTGISGAITALGDTLFPVSQIGEAWSRSFTTTEHIFVKLRVYHPMIAISTGAFLIFMARRLSKMGTSLRQPAIYLTFLVLFQLSLGFLNIYLFAPIAVQMIHLLISHLIWITMVFLFFENFPFFRKFPFLYNTLPS